MREINEALLEEIRERFCHVDACPYQGPRIFFENAGGALTLKSVVERSAELAAMPDNQGRDNPASHALSDMIAKGKSDIRALFGATTGTVFVGETGTEVLFRMISAALLGAPAGGGVVGSTLEHPASVGACDRWAGITGREYVRAPHNSQTGTVTARDYEGHVNENTRLATIIHASPVTGMVVDVAEIAGYIRSIAPDCYIIVDGIQHAAHGAMNIDAYGVDGYAISPYKVFSRHGYGIAWVSDRLSALPHDQLIGASPDQWELGTRDAGAYATFSEVVDYFNWLGGKFTPSTDLRERIEAAGEAIHVQETALMDAMRLGVDGEPGLAEMNSVEVIGGIDNPLRQGMLSFSHKTIPAAEMVAALGEEGIRVHVRKNDMYSGNVLGPLELDDCVRVSLCHYNTAQEVARFLKAMRKILGM